MLSQENFLIVGGTRGGGAALVQALSAKNANLIVVGRTACHSTQHNVHYIQMDLLEATPREIQSLFEAVKTRFGTLNHLILIQRFRGDPEKNWEGHLALGLTKAKQLIETSLHYFDPDPNANKSIVGVSSIAAHAIAPEQTVGYHVAKAGLEQMARYYAYTLGSHRIRVNTVSPAIVLKPEAHGFYAAQPELVSLYEQVTPLGRMGTPEDIANAVLFFCSQDASFITGQNLVVDGGLSLTAHESLSHIFYQNFIKK